MGRVNGNYRTGVELGHADFGPTIIHKEKVAGIRSSSKRTHASAAIEAGSNFYTPVRFVDADSTGLIISQEVPQNTTKSVPYAKAAVGVSTKINDRFSLWGVGQFDTPTIAKKATLPEVTYPVGYEALGQSLRADKQKSKFIPNVHVKAGASYGLDSNGVISLRGYVEAGSRALSLNDANQFIQSLPKADALIANSSSHGYRNRFSGVGLTMSSDLPFDETTSFNISFSGNIRRNSVQFESNVQDISITPLSTTTGSQAIVADADVQKNSTVVKLSDHKQTVFSAECIFGVNIKKFSGSLGMRLNHDKQGNNVNISLDEQEVKIKATNINGANFEGQQNANISSISQPSYVYATTNLTGFVHIGYQINSDENKPIYLNTSYNFINSGATASPMFYDPAFNSFQLGLNAKF